MAKRNPHPNRMNNRVAQGRLNQKDADVSIYLFEKAGVEMMLQERDGVWYASFEVFVDTHATGDTPDAALRAFASKLVASGYINHDTYSRIAAVEFPTHLYN